MYFLDFVFVNNYDTLDRPITPKIINEGLGAKPPAKNAFLIKLNKILLYTVNVIIKFCGKPSKNPIFSRVRGRFYYFLI